MDTDQERRSAGTRAGGRYVAAVRPEAAVGLEPQRPQNDDSDADGEFARKIANFNRWEAGHNVGGTFTFPPAPLDPLQVTRFWADVIISDVVLAQFQAAYPEARHRAISRDTTAAMVDDPPPKEPEFLGRTKKFVALDNEWKSRRDQWYAHCEQEYGPPALPSYEVRGVVRRIMEGRQLRLMPADCGSDRHHGLTAQSVLDERDDVIPGEAISRGRAERYYAADQMPDSVFRDPGIDTAAQMSAMNQTLSQVDAELRAIRDDQELGQISAASRNQGEFDRLASEAGFESRR